MFFFQSLCESALYKTKQKNFVISSCTVRFSPTAPSPGSNVTKGLFFVIGQKDMVCIEITMGKHESLYNDHVPC